MASGGIIQLLAEGAQDKLYKTRQSKIVTCVVKHAYNLSSRKGEFRKSIIRDCDVVRDWQLMSDVGYDVIGAVEIVANGNVLVKLSGRCLCIISMLRGTDLRKRKSVSLPFPVMKLVAIPYAQVTVQVNFRRSMVPYLEEQKKIRPFVTDVMVHIGGLADIVLGYIGMDHDIGTVSVYAANMFKSNDDIKRLTSKKMIEPIDQFQETHATIKQGESNVEVNLSGFIHLMKRIVIVFGAANGLNDETLGVLQNGTLVTQGIVHTEFTGDSAHEMDKVMFGAHVPDQPIYTITFDDGKNILDPKRVSSFMNFSRLDKTLLRLSVTPQGFPMTVTVIGESSNVLMTSNGACACIYSD